MREANAKAGNVMSRPKRSNNVSISHPADIRIHIIPAAGPLGIGHLAHSSASPHMNVHSSSAGGAADAC